MKKEAREFEMGMPEFTWRMMRGSVENVRDLLLTPFSYARMLGEKFDGLKGKLIVGGEILLTTLVPLVAGSAAYLVTGRPKLAIFYAATVWAAESLVISAVIIKGGPQSSEELS